MKLMLVLVGRLVVVFKKAMRSLLRKLQTETFEELTAASSVIRPGVAETCAFCRPVSALNNDDLPTFDRPVSANSGKCGGGMDSTFAAPNAKTQSPAKN